MKGLNGITVILRKCCMHPGCRLCVVSKGVIAPHWCLTMTDEAVPTGKGRPVLCQVAKVSSPGQRHGVVHRYMQNAVFLALFYRVVLVTLCPLVVAHGICAIPREE